jgi:hypothetical protein
MFPFVIIHTPRSIQCGTLCRHIPCTMSLAFYGGWKCGLNLGQSFSFVSCEQDSHTSNKPLYKQDAETMFITVKCKLALYKCENKNTYCKSSKYNFLLQSLISKSGRRLKYFPWNWDFYLFLTRIFVLARSEPWNQTKLSNTLAFLSFSLAQILRDIENSQNKR